MAPVEGRNVRSMFITSCLAVIFGLKFKSVSLPDFYKSLSADLFPNLKNFAAKFLTLFGSTYICEQAFSSLQINKSKNRSLLTDINLHCVMRISTSKLAPSFKKIVKNCEQLQSLINFCDWYIFITFYCYCRIS